ncbi:hypothetical protein KM043_007675 [Ampulex compressa]|nr:hypothetical protein KM043_007675 [Ampulex compressa]
MKGLAVAIGEIAFTGRKINEGRPFGAAAVQGSRRKYHKREPEHIRSAVEAVANGMSLRKAAKLFSIPKSVLHRYSKQGIPVTTRRLYVKNKFGTYIKLD